METTGNEAVTTRQTMISALQNPNTPSLNKIAQIGTSDSHQESEFSKDVGSDTAEEAINIPFYPSRIQAPTESLPPTDKSLLDLVIRSCGNTSRARAVTNRFVAASSDLQSILGPDSPVTCFVELSPTRLPSEMQRGGHLAIPLYSSLFINGSCVKNRTSNVISNAVADLFALTRHLCARISRPPANCSE